MVARIADAGFIIALNSSKRAERAWARRVLEKWKAPFITCEGALIEAAHFCAPVLVARLLEDGDFVVTFDLAEQIGPVRALLDKYEDLEIDFTDACIVRMSELFPDCKVFSVDGDFKIYRRFRNQTIPAVCPPDLE
jgi:predicted nucleic acid-binding protein